MQSAVEKHVITYPGFAEGKDAKRLFTDIENLYSDQYRFHILPFYEETAKGDRLVHSIAEHALILQNYMDGLDGQITMLAKCGGSRVAVSIDDEHMARLEKLCLFNPPWKIGFLEKQLARWNGVKHGDGSWSIPRNEIASYVVSKEYIGEASNLSAMERYRAVAKSGVGSFYIFRAENDEVFPPIRGELIDGAQVIDIENGNHHLVGESRKKVLAALARHSIL